MGVKLRESTAGYVDGVVVIENFRYTPMGGSYSCIRGKNKERGKGSLEDKQVRYFCARFVVHTQD